MKTFSHVQIFCKENYLFSKFTVENICNSQNKPINSTTIQASANNPISITFDKLHITADFQHFTKNLTCTQPLFSPFTLKCQFLYNVAL